MACLNYGSSHFNISGRISPAQIYSLSHSDLLYGNIECINYFSTMWVCHIKNVHVIYKFLLIFLLQTKT